MTELSLKSWSRMGRHLIAVSLITLTAGCAGTASQSDASAPPPESPGDHAAIHPPVQAAHSPADTARPLVSVPETDCEIRVWYNYQVVAIPVINQRWVNRGVSLEDRARRAFDLRHKARMNARFMMPSKEEMRALQERDRKKYGNPDGPTFEYLVQKSLKKGISREETYKTIIASSARTDNGYNEKCE